MQYCVYQITCNSPNIDHLYIGSTEDLEQRTRKHTSNSNLGTKTFKLYNTIRDNGGIDNWKLEVMESGTVETRFEIKSRERYYYDELSPDLNMRRPQLSKEELRFYHIEYSKQYKSQNKEKIKEYHLQNKEKIKENCRQFYVRNKDKIKQNQFQYKSQKVHCDACNCESSKGDMVRHKKTQKHLKNLELNKQRIEK